MATLNFAHREITAKVVYIGAAGAGCSSNVRKLHKLLAGSERSQLHKFGPRDTEQRSFFFEYLGEGRINGLQLRYRVYSLPGGLALPAHREEVLRDADAIVFVADARPASEAANMDALLELERLLSLQGLELAAVPVVLQVNHVDEEGARRTEDVVFDLNPYGFPVVAAAAGEGRGVLETHQEATGAVTARIRDTLAGLEAAVTVTAVHEAERITDEDVIRGHLDLIQARTSATPESVQLEDQVSRVEPEEGPRITVPFQPRELLGSRPVQLLSGRIEGSQVLLELLMQRGEADPPQRLTVVLENRPSEPPAAPRPSSATPAPADVDRLADYLPSSIDLAVPEEEEDQDLPGVLYGLVGVFGGVIMGLLAGYLLGVIV